MQLLDSLPNQPPDSTFERSLNALQDIAVHVQIQSNFCVSHPKYAPMELPPGVVTRFQQLPLELQRQYLSLQLRSYLYDIYFKGDADIASTSDTSSAKLSLNSEKNTASGQNSAFYWQLHTNNSGEGYFDPGWLVLKQENDGSLAVKKNNLTLHIQPDHELQLGKKLATTGDIVAIRMPQNLLETGYYLAVGNAGPAKRGQLETTCIYFNFSPEGALAMMKSLTQQLNEVRIPFTFKVVSEAASYKCYDSGILCFDRSDYHIVRPILQKIYQEQRCLRWTLPTHFQPELPLFTKFLAPGLGLAEEPDSNASIKERFGTHRCQIVADGLLDAWHKGDNSIEGRMMSIYQRFSMLGIELQHPYLNANSEDIYTTLDLCEQ
ncbi:T3SS effector HopA1 family protein [Dendronalium sp. ChiSLP03b]|uniref:T3SS effector HopA1 family protein n=1 Tax=Dendronalium sp. ChiSLP03b TaxID=3075381 RepID=UPI002AD3A639|nr:T3SS effector HopA1 family protein [Dendronalium sp. ChiSLP03b]MDZ8205670.1 T3SS effector HopA1 family protein [Dendronalium sp. ChiSLP03b]